MSFVGFTRGMVANLTTLLCFRKYRAAGLVHAVDM